MSSVSKQFPPHSARLPFKQGDEFIFLVGDLYLVMAVTPVLGLVFGGGCQVITGFAGAFVFDCAFLRQVCFVAAVAGAGEGGVGQGEDVSAVADAVAVEHVGLYREVEAGKALAYFGHGNADGL